jgi:hypothetical protein
MFYSSINSQDLSIVPIGISTPPYSDGAYGLSTEFLNPLIKIILSQKKLFLRII